MQFSHILHSKHFLLQAEQTVLQSALHLSLKNICPSFFFFPRFATTSAYVSVTAQVKTAGSSYGEMESGSNRSEKAFLGKPQAKPSCNC